jgi:predicted nucleic acid-binding Zn ribbon protein
VPEKGQASEQGPAPTSDGHDRSGLELARSVVTAIRELSKKRPRQPPRARRWSSPAEMSGAHPDGRDPTPLGSAVDKLVAESGWSTDVAVHAVFGRWPSNVGAEVASHCTPETFADGMLRVRTDSTAWATQLRLLAPTVVRRLNEELGHGTVLRVDVAGPDGPSWRRGRRSVRDGRGPRDTYG